MEIANPAFNYNKEGQFYSGVRRPDPRISAIIEAALGASKTVLNIGAGTGSYEPLDRYVVAIEPSEIMRKQRPRHLVPAGQQSTKRAESISQNELRRSG